MAKILDFKNEYSGLDSAKAEENIELYGYNSDTKLDEKTKGYSPVSAFIDFRFLLMLACSVISFLYGLSSQDGGPQMISGIVLFVLAGIYSAVEIVKNTNCDEYFFELRRRSKTTFRVMRDGEIRHIRRELLVPDDILILSEGESVPADAYLLELNKLYTDESVFSGDKTPVRKTTRSDVPNDDIKKNCIYKGTKVVSGELVARIFGTGVDTKYFRSFGAPEETEEYYTAFEKAVMKVTNIMTIISAVMLVFGCFLRFSAINIESENPALDSVYKTVIPAAAFALCFIPASTASLVRLYYIKGAKKIDENNASVKSLRTIEYINAVTCILIDKNGMITKKHMEIADRYTANKDMLTNISVLACKKNSRNDFDQAIVLAATFAGADVSELHGNRLIKEYEFDEAEGAAGNLWEINGQRLLCIKGAPEKLLPLCDVPNDMLYTVQTKQVSYGNQGYNVLMVAFAQLPDDALIPESISSAHYNFMGLIAFTNQTKDYIPAAVRNCHRAGIRVIMTSGDAPETSYAVAKQIGIKGSTVVTGDMLESGAEFDVADTGVFARITDEQKRLVIKKLREAGEVVAITGETASDSDMLELADVGISLAKNVSGAAFEACDMVTGDDSFESITSIVRLTRQTHINVKRCISVSFVALISMILFALVNLITGTQLLLTPVLVSLISVLIVPAAAMIFINNTQDIKDTMESSAYIGAGLLNIRFFLKPLAQALGIFFAQAIFYLISSGVSTGDAQITESLSAGSRSGFLLIFVTGLLLSCMTDLCGRDIKSLFSGKFGFAWIMSAVIFALTLIMIFVPYFNEAFGLSAMSIPLFLIAAAIAAVFQIPAAFIDTSRKETFVSVSPAAEPEEEENGEQNG